MPKTKRVLKLIGIALMVFALISNPFVIEQIFSPDKNIDSLSKVVFLDNRVYFFTGKN